ncbi:hypothetical protein ABY58_00730 [Edwardsiella ictaluri]|nr:hypothetical protein ABY58_00730 [Edwardsiella ictaluri]
MAIARRGAGAGKQDLSRRQSALRQVLRVGAISRGIGFLHGVNGGGQGDGGIFADHPLRRGASPPRRGMTARIVLAGGGINRIV